MTKMKLTKGQIYDLDTLRFVGWTAEGDGSETDGYNWMDYFDADGRYYGPDIYGIEPLFAVMAAIRQDRNGKWWIDLDGDGHFDPDLIGPCANGVWLYDGAPRESIMGPYDSEADVASRLASIVDADAESAQ